MFRMHDAMIRCLLATAAIAGLAGCGGQGGGATNQAVVDDNGASILESSPETNNVAMVEPKESVMRPSVMNEVAPVPPPKPEPFRAVIPFAYGGSKLGDDVQPILDQVLKAAQKAADAPIVIRGHTDSKGNDEDNKRVSLERAEAVRDYLADHGIARERMTVIGLGETRPVAPNALLNGEDNEAGRQKNRRVVVVVGAPDQPPEAAESPPGNDAEEAASGQPSGS